MLAVIAKRRKAASPKVELEPKGSAGPETVSGGLWAPKKQQIGPEVFGVGRKVLHIEKQHLP
jgi:hypothetical protein